MTLLRRLGLPLAALLLAFGLIGLGVWQVQRLAWKQHLIAAVDSRKDAAPISAAGPDQWATLSPEQDVYRRVTATGVFRHDQSVLVQAVTERGGGFWVMTPLDIGRYRIFINRGFVPPEKAKPASRAEGDVTDTVTVTGLMRFSEPKGGFLRDNDPAADRWFSRDIAAMAKAKAVTHAAPYFIDADATPNAGGYPIGGMTVVTFTNNHLVYALTWFGLAGIAFFFAWMLWRSPRRQDNVHK
ncbi:SURF1 family protein [Sphingopyxis yananensis]|uniref:SURF1 family protein n=1 Tax=Sphingopyxis yananensis TaxID=2886687 RepID=UPI001D12F644|nr:SURF1 family protein [Sphingopyxis yananensis]MCC2603326.1 SURF1 family protein [Sphingopyxis yananensis]